MNDFFRQLEELSARAQNYRYQGADQRLAELREIIERAKEKTVDTPTK
jgi:hypothetical protein